MDEGRMEDKYREYRKTMAGMPRHRLLGARRSVVPYRASRLPSQTLAIVLTLLDHCFYESFPVMLNTFHVDCRRMLSRTAALANEAQRTSIRRLAHAGC